MFYIKEIENGESLYISKQIDNVDFILLIDSITMSQFKTLRTQLFDLNNDNSTNNQNKYRQYSIENLDGSDFGMFALRYDTNNEYWKWELLEDYIDFTSNRIDMAEEASTRARLLYAARS